MELASRSSGSQPGLYRFPQDPDVPWIHSPRDLCPVLRSVTKYAISCKFARGIFGTRAAYIGGELLSGIRIQRCAHAIRPRRFLQVDGFPRGERLYGAKSAAGADWPRWMRSFSATRLTFGSVNIEG